MVASGRRQTLVSAPCTYWTGSQVDHRASLDMVAKRTGTQVDHIASLDMVAKRSGLVLASRKMCIRRMRTKIKFSQ
jgi:hypothetical protein